MDISNLREEYTKAELLEHKVEANPIIQFKKWFENAVEAAVNEPNAMNLATINNQNRPSARIVLLKYVNDNGFSFFTNYESSKGNQLAHHPAAALTFFWPELERQIRIEGIVSKLSDEESVRYFLERPRKSQLGAWASAQSIKIRDRDYLEEQYEKYEKEFASKEMEKPPFWGGYILKPDYFEFWQGRRSRLHDRITYQLNQNLIWEIARLSP